MDSPASKYGKARDGFLQFPLCPERQYAYIRSMNWLTRQEQFVLAAVLSLLLVGVAVKTYRTANPTIRPGDAGLDTTNKTRFGSQ